MTDSRRVALVTGGSSGIGRATALRLARRGDHVLLVARGEASLREAAAECERAGAASATTLVADVGDDAAVAACFDAAIASHGGIDIVVNSAGVVAYGRMEEVPADVFEGVLRTNLVGSVNVARHALKHFRARDHGHLVLVGSMIGHIAVPSMSPYVLSKWGVRALSRQLDIENRDRRDVHVSYVAPPGVDTPIYTQAANYVGVAGHPPLPVVRPEVVARAIERQLEGRRRREQVGVANDLIRFGFTALPRLYDVLVGPLFDVAARDETRPVPAGPGNVLHSVTAGNALRGDAPSGAAGIARNLASRIRSRRSAS